LVKRDPWEGRHEPRHDFSLIPRRRVSGDCAPSFRQTRRAKRVAFVVGIDAYDNLPVKEQLQKAVNDAHALGEALTGLGYQVVSTDNGDRRGFDENWQDVASGALVGKLDHADDVQSVVLSPDGSALAFGDGDKMVKLWHLRSVQAAGR
jgi:hypothetical protein